MANLSIKNKLGLMVGSLMLIIALMFILTLIATKQQKNDGLVINLAGRQRMLTQKMTKELLLVANGIDADANKANLGKTVALFQSTLNGLLDGDEGLGLPGTRDQAIRDQLSIVQGLWEQYKPVLDAIDTSDAGLTKAAKLNLPLIARTDAVSYTLLILHLELRSRFEPLMGSNARSVISLL